MLHQHTTTGYHKNKHEVERQKKEKQEWYAKQNV